MEKILEFLEAKKEFKEFSEAIKQQGKAIQISNTTEEGGMFLVLSAHKQAGGPIVVVTPNLYHAQIVYDKLSAALDPEEVLFFPQDEFITSEMLVSSWEFRIERINTIKRLIENNNAIVVTHLPGLIKPQLEPEAWKNAMFSLCIKQEISIDKLSSKLIMSGYSHEYTVEKMGDFSVRGGIVDVFPLGEKTPVRLDFFGDEIDTMKRFDIESQRSQESCEKIDVMPMTELFFDDKGLKTIKNEVKTIIRDKKLSSEAIEKIDADLESLERREDLERLSRYQKFLFGQQNTILDFIPKSTVFFFDFHRFNGQYDGLKQDLLDWIENAGDYAKMGFDFFVPLENIKIEKPIYVDYLREETRLQNIKKISIAANEPLKFEGNINLVLNELRSLAGQRTLVIALESYKSRTEMCELLSDNKLDYVLTGDTERLKENSINIIVSDRCFDFASEAFGLTVITEKSINKKQTSKRKGKYLSAFDSSKRLASVNDLKPGDYVVHYDYGIGRFLDIKTMELGNTRNDYINIEYRDGDKLYIPLESFSDLQKYAGSEGFVPRLSKLGGSDWNKAKQRVRSKAGDIAERLIRLYSQREKAKGYSFRPNAELESELEIDFPYEETRDQNKAIKEVFSDMESPRPMDRLLCGDVGFGKTEIALRAAFRAVLNNKQVAYLAPTTVLSKQHFQTFTSRLEKYGVNIVLLNRFVTGKAQKQILTGLENGSIDIVIGTHRVLGKDVAFKDLGLLIVDEEQRFGVQHKEKIKEFKVNVDVLSLSATPIPRTLQMAIMGVKSMSLLESAPENRYPIQTYVIERNDAVIKDAIERELAREGQVYYLYNRVDDIENIAIKIQKLVPEARVCIAHGQMHKLELEAVIDDFIDRKTDVLVATTIIETGIDIPNVNTLIIHDADKLGLAQLYQIRGRVGRSDRIAYAYLMFKKDRVLTEDAEKRLKVIKEFTELGSGFKIAVRDLSIRGAGDVLGSEQSGFIDSVGVDMYMRILEEEINAKQGKPEIKETKPGIKATVSRYIDEEYINDDFVKIEMYKKINSIKNKKDIADLLAEFKDRFGEYIPELEIYLYEKLFEKLSKMIDGEKLIESKTNVTLVISEDGTKKMSGEALFTTGLEISNYIRFAYRHNKISIIVDTVGLEKHWLYTMVDFLEKIVSENK